jgi:hypothetical protein
MFEKFISRFVESISLRLLFVGIIALPIIGITTSWEGASYLSVLIGAPFAKTFFGLLIPGVSAVFVTAFVILYPVERWLIRDKASNSWKWVVVRILLYLLVSFPTSIATLVAIRTTMQEYPAIVESIYFVEAVTCSFTAAILFTLVEQVIKEVKKRENILRTEIQELRIKIDQLNRQKQVTEIIDSEFFQDLKQKVAIIRKDKAPN